MKSDIVNWMNVCIIKEQRGLGIRKLDLLNRAIPGKWVWRFAIEDDKVAWKCDQWHNNGAKMGGSFIKNQRDSYGVSLELSLERHVQRSGST